MIPKHTALKQNKANVGQSLWAQGGGGAAYHCFSNSRAVIMLSHACRTEVAAKYVVALQPTVSSNMRHENSVMYSVLQRQ